MAGDIVTVKAVHTCDCSTAIVRADTPTAAMDSSSTASTNGRGTATIRLSLQPSRFSSGCPARPLRIALLAYFALLLPVP